jgi:prepilin-type N-terminal cleavage/methylation domain-containing protein
MRIPTVRPARPTGCRAFSFVELMIATAVFGLVISAIVYANLVGLTMLDITRPKQEAELQSSRLYDLLVDDIASARKVEVGQGDTGLFTATADGLPKQGYALKLYPSLEDNNLWILYYRDATDQTLKRATNGELNGTVVAMAVTNDVVFSALGMNNDFNNPLTNDQRNLTVGIQLSFALIERSATPVGPTNYFRSYRLETRVTPRAF